MIYLGLKVFYHIYFTGIIIEMMITEIEETVMKGERNKTGELLRLVAIILIQMKGEQIYNSYIDILDPIQLRKKHLLETKQMNCW